MPAVQQITLGQAVNLTLDNYYDLVKAKVGNLGADEYLQLKISCDAIDISDQVNEGGYKFFSYYNLLQRADLTIDNGPISGELLTNVAKLSDVYGEFLDTLLTLVKFKPLTQAQQDEIEKINLAIGANKDKAMQLLAKEQKDWADYCKIKGVNPADVLHYEQWTIKFGQSREINDLFNDNDKKRIKKKKILDSILEDPADQTIIDAVSDFESPSFYLRYPVFPDYEYLPTVLSLPYLKQLPSGSSSLFDDRRAIGIDKTLNFVKTSNDGRFSATLDNTTNESNTIETSWSASTSVRKFIFSVKIDASETTKIQEEFNNVTGLTLKSESTITIGINYGAWFKPSLFSHPKILQSPTLFQKFFGKNGTLRYYATKFVVIRGFSTIFKNTNDWTYDYERNFSVGGGSGFSIFGLNFGLSGNYSQHIKNHKFIKNGTDLTITDDPETVRFIGYVVRKNTILEQSDNEIFNVFKDDLNLI